MDIQKLILLNPFMNPKNGYSSEDCWLTMPNTANRSSKELTEKCFRKMRITDLMKVVFKAVVSRLGRNHTETN